ncbi:hypothetical protein GC177_02795 [bacterium]|nr:hypothetical protein [bacterium]
MSSPLDLEAFFDTGANPIAASSPYTVNIDITDFDYKLRRLYPEFDYLRQNLSLAYLIKGLLAQHTWQDAEDLQSYVEEFCTSLSFAQMQQLHDGMALIMALKRECHHGDMKHWEALCRAAFPAPLAPPPGHRQSELLPGLSLPPEAMVMVDGWVGTRRREIEEIDERTLWGEQLMAALDLPDMLVHLEHADAPDTLDLVFYLPRTQADALRQAVDATLSGISAAELEYLDTAADPNYDWAEMSHYVLRTTRDALLQWEAARSAAAPPEAER